MTPLELTLSITTLVATVGAVVMGVLWRRSVNSSSFAEIRRLSNEADGQRKRAWKAEDSLRDMTRKREDAWKRYIDALDELAELKNGQGGGEAA